jgi:UDPglucose 6-dehydrogenase/GDP-mannose 6-dehydrogenase
VGCGFGGSCLPKDVGALIAHGEQSGTPMRLLRSVLDINAGQPGQLVALARDGLGGLDGRRVAVLGLAFKPDTDDLRESPAFPVIDGLRAEGAVVTAHDPVAVPAARARLARDVATTDDLETALTDADAVVIDTRWDQYQAVPKILIDRDPQPLVVDGRRMLDRDSIARYTGIGLGAELTEDTP